MAFGSFDAQGTTRPMGEINMIPLIDVMLVLLVIFIITAPLMTHSVRLDLPRVQAQPTAPRAEAITLSIDASGKAYWNNQPLADFAELGVRLREVAAAEPPRDVHVRADGQTHYESIAQVMALARSAGVRSLAFVTDPRGSAAPSSGASRSVPPHAHDAAAAGASGSGAATSTGAPQ